MWLGYTSNKTCVFRLSDDYEKYDKKLTEQMNDGHKYGKVPAISVFTNLDIPKRHEDLVLWQRYYDDNGDPLPDVEERYPHYDNYAAINVDKVSDIPVDYFECIGVPITFLDKYNPEQFEIVQFRKGNDGKDLAYIKPVRQNINDVERERESCSVLQNHYQTNTSRRVLMDGTLTESESTQECLSVEDVKKILMSEFGYEEDEIDYCNGIMGVPITFLDKYNPEQFEIVELGNSRDNFTPNKDYTNPKKHLKNGDVVSGGAINCVLAIETKQKPTDVVYYTSDNSVFLIPPYARILIRRKVVS